MEEGGGGLLFFSVKLNKPDELILPSLCINCYS